MGFEALGGPLHGHPHDGGVVDQHVDARLLLQHAGAELVDALQGAGVAVLHHDLAVRLAADLHRNVLTELGVLEEKKIGFFVMSSCFF